MSIATLTSNETGANSLIDINANFADLDTTKADLASPTFTGTPTLPTGTTGVTQSLGDNSTKLATTAFVIANSGPITLETTTGVTHSLVTTAVQRVIVWAKGTVSNNGSTAGIALKYGGTQKDVIVTINTAVDQSFSLMYTETPGAATANITVETSYGSLTNVVIIVMKIG